MRAACTSHSEATSSAPAARGPVADATPEVELVGEVGAQRVRREPQPFRQGEPLGRVAQHLLQPQLPQLRADARVDGHVEVVDAGSGPDRRQDRRLGEPSPHPRLLDPRDRPRHVEVGVQHRIDDLVKHGIGEGPPPFQGSVGAARRIPGERVGKRPNRLRRQLGQRRIGRQRAGPEEAAPKGCQHPDAGGRETAPPPARHEPRGGTRSSYSSPGMPCKPASPCVAGSHGSPRARRPSRASLNHAVNVFGSWASSDWITGRHSHLHAPTSRVSGAGTPWNRPTST